MKKRLFKEKTKEQPFWYRKTTVRIVAFAVVFIFLSPLLLVPNTAHAFSLDFGSLASGALKGAFGGASSYVGGSVFDYLSGRMGSGFSGLVSQRQRWQNLYNPAMKTFMGEMDRQWVSSVPGFFTTTLLYPELAFETVAGDEHQSFQQAGYYGGPVESAQKVMGYYNNQSAARSTYQEAQKDIEEATESEGINFIGSDNKIAKDIAASQALDSAAAAAVAGGSGGGGLGAVGKVVGAIGTIASFFGI